MDNKKIVTFIENSFLHSLLTDTGVTDISYNGFSLFYLHNLYGRKESDINISNTDAKDFIRQIANLAEKQFSFQNPILDVSSEKYRVNAVHNSIARFNDEPVITFAIRIASNKPRITDTSGFLTPELVSLLSAFINSNISLVIGGITGSGKTEFQKYLISKMKPNTRVIAIDNVLEIGNKINPKIDLNIWQYDDRNASKNIQLLVRNALRSNPDWLIVAESRGEEMLEVLNSTLTGHPIITTIHASSANYMPIRLTRMVMMNDKKSNYSEVLTDVCTCFPIQIYLKRKFLKNGTVLRFIESIIYVDENNNHFPIYLNKYGVHKYFPILPNYTQLKGLRGDELFKRVFKNEK